MSDRTTLDLGVDVGSVSAKVVVMDSDGRVLADVYRRVHGRPAETTTPRSSRERRVGEKPTGSG